MSETARPALPPGMTRVTPHLVVDGAAAVMAPAAPREGA